VPVFTPPASTISPPARTIDEYFARSKPLNLCNQCPYRDSDARRFQQHTLSVHAVATPFGCPACTCAYEAPSALKQHYNHVHRRGMAPLPEPGTVSGAQASSANSQPHALTTCEQCKMTFTKRRELESHICSVVLADLEEVIIKDAQVCVLTRACTPSLSCCCRCTHAFHVRNVQWAL
jgi:hypothetical protein